MKRRTCRGQALVPVLFVVFILTAFAVTVTTSSRRETRSSGAFLRETQANFIARGAIRYAAAALQEGTGGGTTPPQLSIPPETDSNGWTQLGDGWYKLEVIDTTSRVNINTATIQSLAKLPGLLNTNIPACIIDWRDEDDTPTAGQNGTGAESDFYQSQNPPYSVKNQPFDTIDELLLVSGINPAILYGSPGSQTGSGGVLESPLTAPGTTRQTPGGGQNPPQEEPEGPPVDTSASPIPLAELITTYSKELNVDFEGAKRVNISSADAQALQGAGFPQQIAQRIVEARQQTPFTSVADLLNVQGVTRQIMQQVGDKVTITDEQFRNGVLNINSASDEAMATIPGVDATVYNAVIEARRGGMVFNGLNDLFQLTSLNRRQLQALLDHVCTKSSVYLVRVKVRMPGSRRVLASQALIELAPPPPDETQAQPGQTPPSQPAQQPAQGPVILQWREVSRTPGWSSWAPAPDYFGMGGAIGGR